MKQKRIRVLKVEPGKEPTLVTLNNNLDDLQKAVSIGAPSQGLIEIITLEEDVCILCNEEGKLISELKPNRRLGNDILVGTFYVTGQDRCGNLTTLSEAKMQKYAKLFEKPCNDITDEEVANTLVMRFYGM